MIKFFLLYLRILESKTQTLEISAGHGLPGINLILVWSDRKQ